MQHCLLNSLQKLKNSVDDGKSFGPLFRDLSKAYDCFDHKLVTPKLNTWGLRLIDDEYSSWSEIIFVIMQGSILRPLLFDIFWRISFFVAIDIAIASYADDSTPFIVKSNIDNIIASLEQVSGALFDWFKNNRLKSNIDKCYVLVSTKNPAGMKIGDSTLDNSECEKLLGVKIDVHLNFNYHIS